jgi:hypothetical protein
MELPTIGIDLGKTVFHLVRLNMRGAVVALVGCEDAVAMVTFGR